MRTATAITTATPWQRERDALSLFAPVHPALLASRELLSRVDTKFLLNGRDMLGLLSEIRPFYSLLSTPGTPWAAYHTTYFDTEDLELFHDHRRGRRIRFKIRLRHYLDRHLSYLEIKKKERADETYKLRRELPYATRELSDEDWSFISEATAPRMLRLQPSVVVEYRRITLISRLSVERATFDCGLVFSHDADSRCFDDVVIVELKQEKPDRTAPCYRALRDRGARPTRASKYALGVMALERTARTNRLKPTLRAFEGVNHG